MFWWSGQQDWSFFQFLLQACVGSVHDGESRVGLKALLRHHYRLRIEVKCQQESILIKSLQNGRAVPSTSEGTIHVKPSRLDRQPVNGLLQ